MFELLVLASVLGAWYVAVFLFSYHVAIGHVDRLLEIEEGQAPPQLLPELGEYGEKRALSADDIDRMDDWDRWE
ncbi:hypothetical protein AArcCO_3002 [Halalkaliarchaeum sp. AArc-CO]|uniref:hypothetical protein n=1 Tax=unclassified Halalkaliarchaeum TaxID=2678344 RepID=UPI00217DC37A|nr:MULTISPECIES: hypothetical protein [unclassified Halalkaliarchaeum]MDR5672832.1 hypothetical protein [Halalkaliarchaeum sp. AArc-GB]UWG52274.1 hypothetical protein AArcCO_3002 [Halalkaliarchaeum sp. AArc-CO]